VEPEDMAVNLYCVTEDGFSVFVQILDYQPWVHLELPEDSTESDAALVVEALREFVTVVDWTAEERWPGYGYSHTRRLYIKLTVANDVEWQTLVWKLRREPGVQVGERSVQVVPADDVAGISALFFHDTGVTPARWMQPLKYRLHDRAAEGRRSTTQFELTVSWKDLRPVERTHEPALVYASFDSEVMSYSGELPRVWRDGAEVQDHTICVSLAFWVQGRPIEDMITVVLYNGDCEEPLHPSLKEFDDSINDKPLSPYECLLRHVEWLGPADQRRIPHIDPALDYSRLVTTDSLRYHPGRVFVHCFRNTVVLYEALRHFLTVLGDADVVLGWNNYGFDSPFLQGEYARNLGAQTYRDQVQDDAFLLQYNKMGTFLSKRWVKTPLFTKEMNTAAKGENVYKFHPTVGVAQLDLMQVVKDNVKRDNYTLASVAQDYGACLKYDLPAQRIFELVRRPNAKHNAAIALYCAWDSVLPLQIYSALAYANQMNELAALTKTSLHDIFNRGQRARAKNMMAGYSLRLGYALKRGGDGIWQEPDGEMKPFPADTSLYEGAIVLDPPGGYMDEVLGTCDYEGLYPSIMQTFWLCASNFALDPREAAKARA
jgi:hypothetical protein